MLFSKEYYEFYYSNPSNITNPRLRKPLYKPKETIGASVLLDKVINEEEPVKENAEKLADNLTLECLNIDNEGPKGSSEEEKKKLMNMIDVLDKSKVESFHPQNPTIENQYNMMFTQPQPWIKETPTFQPQYVPPPMMYTFVDPNYISPAPLYFQNPNPQYMMPTQSKPFYPYASKPKQMAPTSQFIEEFKLKMNIPKVSAAEFKGHVYELSKDHNGSKFIQQQIESGDDESKQMIVQEIIESPSDIIKDVFGNYVVQKILENSNEDVKKKISLKMKGQVKVLALDPYGCRVLQKAIELFSSEGQSQLCEELDGFVKSCVDNQNGNHVIQKCVERMAIQDIGFIINYFNSNIIEMSKHNYGCRVIQRLLEKNQTFPAVREMVGKLIKNVEELAMDAFGNYVIQHVLEHGTTEDMAMVHNIVKKNLYMMSRQKFSSNVIEKALQHGTEAQKRELIRTTMKEENGLCILGDMMRDKFANYVVQKCIEHSDLVLLKELQAKITKVTDQNQYCYHVQNALNKKLEALKSCK